MRTKGYLSPSFCPKPTRCHTDVCLAIVRELRVSLLPRLVPQFLALHR